MFIYVMNTGNPMLCKWIGRYLQYRTYPPISPEGVLQVEESPLIDVTEYGDEKPREAASGASTAAPRICA